MHGFSDLSQLRNGNVLQAGVWDICVRVLGEHPVRDQAIKGGHLLRYYQFPQVLFPPPDLPWLMDTAATVQTHSCPVRSHHTTLRVIAGFICRGRWLSATSCQLHVPPGTGHQSEASCAESTCVMSRPFSLQRYATVCPMNAVAVFH